MVKAVARTRKITIDVEVPEGVGEELVRRVVKALMFVVTSGELSRMLSEEDARELAAAMEESLWKRLQSY